MLLPLEIRESVTNTNVNLFEINEHWNIIGLDFIYIGTKYG